MAHKGSNQLYIYNIELDQQLFLKRAMCYCHTVVIVKEKNIHREVFIKVFRLY